MLNRFAFCDSGALIRGASAVSRMRQFRLANVARKFSGVKVTASQVKELRERSGAPMMDCKKALAASEVNGDMALAMDWLRKKGIAKAVGSGDRVTREGLIGVNTSSSGSLTLLEVNSETG